MVLAVAADPERAQQENRPWAGGSDTDKTRWLEDGSYDRRDAMGRIRRGSLQTTAAMLLDQLTQKTRGESEMHAGMRDLEDAKEAYRKSWNRRGK